MSDILSIFFSCISFFLQLSERRHEMFLEKLFFMTIGICAPVIIALFTVYLAVYVGRFVMG